MKKALAILTAVAALGLFIPLSQARAGMPIFVDTFDRADGGLGSPWVTTSSTWGVRSNHAVFLTGNYTSTTGVASVPIASTTDAYTSVDITLSLTPLRANAGLTPAFVDYNNNMFCKIEVTAGNPHGLMSIGRRLNGTMTSGLAVVRNAGFVSGGTYHVGCARTGSTITMTVGSNTIGYAMSPTDLAKFGTTTKVGLRGHLSPNEDNGGSTYDNFNVSDTAPSPSPSPSPDPSPSPSPEPTVLTVVAISDICGNVNTNCRQTAALVASIDPDFILAVGDEENSANATIADYTSIFNPAWGSLVRLMRPVPGNHEYNDPTVGAGAEGYRAYFPDDHAPAAGPLYYSFDAGNWHFVGLDTDKCQAGENCPTIDQTTDTQFRWMVNDLSNDEHTCDLAFGHHPAFSSPGFATQAGRHGSTPWMAAAWRQLVAAGVDLYFSGHDHDYERFMALDGEGNPAPLGTRQFVIGTGGAGKLAFEGILPTSEFHYTGLGATIFTLADDAYSWTLVSTTGAIIDRGGPVSCH